MIQVAQDFLQPATREREARIDRCFARPGIDARAILLDANAEPIETNGLTMEVRSLAEWLLQA